MFFNPSRLKVACCSIVSSLSFLLDYELELTMPMTMTTVSQNASSTTATQTSTATKQGTAVELASMTFLMLLLLLITVIDETDGGGLLPKLPKIRWASTQKNHVLCFLFCFVFTYIVM